MDLHLPLLADVNFHVGIAEEACDEGAWVTARNNLDKAEVSFEELRGYWPDFDATERGLFAAMVAPVRARYEATLRRVPVVAAISQGEPEADAEDETPPPE
jgi:hypothetical protein